MRATTSQTFPRWAGSRQDVANLVRQTEKLIADATKQAVETKVNATVGSVGYEYDSVEEFLDSVGDNDLPAVTALAFTSGSTTTSAAVSLAPVLLTVKGDSRTIVEGLRHQLIELVGEGVRPPRLRAGDVQIAVIFGAMALSLVAILAITAAIEIGVGLAARPRSLRSNGPHDWPLFGPRNPPCLRRGEPRACA